MSQSSPALVLDLKARLEKSLSLQREAVGVGASVDRAAVSDMLKALGDVTMTLELLKETKIGQTVNAWAKLNEDAVVKKLATDLVAKWKTLVSEPPRASARPKATVNYKEPSEGEVIAQAEKERAADVKKMVTGSKVTVYKERKALPKRDEDGCFIFADYPTFRPNLSPAEVLKRGSFGGTYFRPISSKVTGLRYGTEAFDELPKEWLQGMSPPDIRKKLLSPTYDASVNTYRVKCGAGLDEWESSGWIKDCDPYGWFQWYCRFFQGRRCDDDDRQVGRGLSCMGPTGRWRINLMNKILAGQGNKSLQQALDNHNISPVVRQTLQHWGYSPTLEDLEKHVKKKHG